MKIAKISKSRLLAIACCLIAMSVGWKIYVRPLGKTLAHELQHCYNTALKIGYVPRELGAPSLSGAASVNEVWEIANRLKVPLQGRAPDANCVVKLRNSFSFIDSLLASPFLEWDSGDMRLQIEKQEIEKLTSERQRVGALIRRATQSLCSDIGAARATGVPVEELAVPEGTRRSPTVKELQDVADKLAAGVQGRGSFASTRFHRAKPSLTEEEWELACLYVFFREGELVYRSAASHTPESYELALKERSKLYPR